MTFGWLQSLWPRRKLTHWDVCLYTRQGCHLCEQAWEQLEEARRRYQFVLRQEDVDNDPQLTRDHGECVPVVVINGRVRFRGRINPVLLQRLFQAGESQKD